jgi:hypothetical protein
VDAGLRVAAEHMASINRLAARGGERSSPTVIARICCELRVATQASLGRSSTRIVPVLD